MYVKKTDIRKACNNCIKAKAACDNNRPCFRCSSHKIADTCANVQRKHNVSKRRRFYEGGVDYEDAPMDASDGLDRTSKDSLRPYNLSYMINNSLNNIITNLNSTGTNNYQTMPPQLVEGEVNGHSVVSNVISTAIQNLNTRSTSAIISNTISNLNNYNPTHQAFMYESTPPPAVTKPTTSSQEVDYESVLQWLQSAATNVPVPDIPSQLPQSFQAPQPSQPSQILPPIPTPQTPQTPQMPQTPQTPQPSQLGTLSQIPIYCSAPQSSSFHPPPTPPPHLNGDHAPRDYNSFSFVPPQPQSGQNDTPPSQISTPQQQHSQLVQIPSRSSSPSQILPPPPFPTNGLPPQTPPAQPLLSQQITPQYTTSQSPAPSPATSDFSPGSPMISLPDLRVNSDLLSLPTLNITMYTKSNRNTAAAYSYVSNLLKHSPQGATINHDADAQSSSTHPHYICIPHCSASSLVQTLSLLRQYSAIDMNSPIHIDYTYTSVSLKSQPVALIEISGPTLVDCSDSFAQFFGSSSAQELIGQNRPLADYLLPEGVAISRRTIELFFRLKTPQLERYQVFLLRNRPARVFLTQHELVGSRHRTITFLEEYPDFPLCFFSSWIKTLLPNAVLPPCPRLYCNCKYPDEHAKIG